MAELLRRIETLKKHGKMNENLTAETDPDTGDVTIHKYIPLTGPKRATPCISELLTLYTFQPDNPPLNGMVDLSRVMVQIPEDGTLEDTLDGFEAFMADITATYVRVADTWLGAMRRIAKMSETKEEKDSVVKLTTVETAVEDKQVENKDGERRVNGDRNMDRDADRDVGGNENSNENGEVDEDKDEEDDWKEPTLTEQCQRMYREINDVLKRRNLAAAEGRWRHWEQLAGAEIIMRVRHMWWMDLDENKPC